MPEGRSWWICHWPAPGRALQTEGSIPRPTPNARREESHQAKVFSGSFKSCFKVSRYYRGPPGSSRDAQSELPQHRPWPSAASGLAWPGPGIQGQLETMVPSGGTVHPGKSSENPSWLALWRHREWCLPAPPSTPRNVSASNPSLGRNVAALPGSKELFWGLLCLPQALASGSPLILAPEGLPSRFSHHPFPISCQKIVSVKQRA